MTLAAPATALHCRVSALRTLCDSPRVSDLRRARFARLVARAIAELPERYRDKMRNVQVMVVDEPDLGQERDGASLLGLYEGVPLTERREEPWLPDRISIFRRNIEAMSSSPRVQAKIIRDTVIHEIAHHFGITDERLDELGR